jgi:hypothetical protein
VERCGTVDGLGDGCGTGGFAWRGNAAQPGIEKQRQQQLNSFGCSVALPGCLLPGSGGPLRGPARRSAPGVHVTRATMLRKRVTLTHGLLSATPRQDAASAIHWHRMRCHAIKSREPAFPVGHRKIRVASAGYPDRQANIVERLSRIPGRRCPCI